MKEPKLVIIEIHSTSGYAIESLVKTILKWKHRHPEARVDIVYTRQEKEPE